MTGLYAYTILSFLSVMKKKLLIIFGVMIIIVTILRGIMYLHDFSVLDAQQQEMLYNVYIGNIIGSVILLVAGGLLLFFGLRIKKK